MDGPVNALHVFDDNLIAGGQFYQAGGTPAFSVAQWNGSQWTSLGGGISGLVYTLMPYHEILYAGGFFEQAGGSWISNLARWDGQTWLPLDSGVDGYVYCLLGHLQGLHVGGRFSRAGSTRSSDIAVWVDDATPIGVSDLVATWTSEGAVLSWDVSMIEHTPTWFLVQRAADAEGPYRLIREIECDAPGRQSIIDRQALSDSDLWYRICASDHTGVSSCSAATLLQRVYTDSSIGLGRVAFVQKNTVRIECLHGHQKEPASLAIFDVRGRKVRGLFRNRAMSGVNVVDWDLTMGSGVPVPNGLYFLRFNVGQRLFRRKIVVAR
jgi:hypothetical protein